MGSRPIHINSIIQCPTQITAQNQVSRSVKRMIELKMYQQEFTVSLKKHGVCAYALTHSTPDSNFMATSKKVVNCTGIILNTEIC